MEMYYFIGELVAAKYNADFYALDQYPSAVRFI